MKLARILYRGKPTPVCVEERLLIEPAGGTVLGQVGDWPLLAPCRPSKIVAVGRNYAAHAAELDHPIPQEPLIFIKPPSAVIGPQAAIVYPSLSRRVDYEAELAVVIGRRARQVPASTALDYVLGYTCANDVTARDLQPTDGQWSRAKGFDTFCPLGPWIATGLDPGNLWVRCWVNGQLRQAGHTAHMLFSVPHLLEYISQVMTLEPEDVILTGTPAGVGEIHPGDQIEIEIDEIGRLTNLVSLPATTMV